MTKTWEAAFLAVLLLGVPGCGGLRYSQVAPEAKDFRPRSIAVLPAEATTFPEAKGAIDGLFAEILGEQKHFDRVIGGGAFARRLERDAELRQTAAEYLAKLDKVNFSDPALSARIGELIEAEALLLVRVDYWNHTTEKDTKVGKVSLSITMVEAQTGIIVWAAHHQRSSDYVILKPDLRDVARNLIREMIGYMPR